MAKNQKPQKEKFRINLNKVDEYNKPNPSKFKTEEANDPKPTKKPFDKKTYRLKKYSKKYKLDQWEDNRKKAVLRDYYRRVKEPDHKFDVAEIYNDPRNRNSDDEDKAIEEQNISVNQDKSDVPTNNQKGESVFEETHEPQDISVKHKKKKPIQKAHEELRRIKEAKQKKREDYSKAKAEKEEALKKYRKEKSIKYKRLSKKTKKGQPIMKDRIELLLEKIQKSVN